MINPDNRVIDQPKNTWNQAKKWSGITDLTQSVKELQQGNYAIGVYHFASGILRIAVTAFLIHIVIQAIIASANSKSHTVDNYQFAKAGRIPIVDQSQIQSENIFRTPGESSLTLITAYDDGIKDYAQHVIPNQRAFAKKHKYDYIEYHGNLALDNGHLRAPYWSKIVALDDQLKKTKEGEWIVWLDASALFTNTEKNFKEIIERYGSDKDIIVTTDPQVPINNAVFLIRNSPWTKKWIKQVWKKSDLAMGGKGRCWSGDKPICHYEQQAMTEIWENDSEVRKHTALIPNKLMNSFYRYSHYDSYRQMELRYDGDPESSKWSSGDFICKVTGMDRDRRLAIIEYVAQNCIDKDCKRKFF